MKDPVVLNSKGEPIVLNEIEQKRVGICQRMVNALGYEISITTLTQIIKKVTEQKFFEIAPADYIPVRVGEGAWSSNLVTYRSFDVAGNFEQGLVNTGGQNDQLATADAGVDSVSIKVFNWAKSIGWSIMDLEMASKAGNWDIIAAKEKARKRNWDLGIQRIAFLGARGINAASGPCLGLLNLGTSVTTDTTTITQPISAMSTSDLKQFCSLIVEKYRANVNRTAWPTHFIIPESDYNGLAAQASPDFPIKSTLELLEDMFKVICRNKNFKILPLAYGDKAYHTDITSIVGKQVYVLLNYDEESIRMDLPVDYNPTMAQTVNGFQYQNVAYGQFTGVGVYRPLEIMYFVY